MLGKAIQVLTMLAVVAASHAARAADPINGAGSTAAAPVYQIWSTAYAAAGGPGLNYGPVGSSAGVAKIRERAVDFGASDVIPPEADLNRDGLVAVPTVVTAAVPFVNIPRVGANALRLSGPLLARIFLGEVTDWSAPEIRELNPGLPLPSLPIRVVVRADGSGTTANFADYLAKVSPAWKQQRGVRSSYEWPKEFLAARGSDGVVKAVHDTTGAIGYVDYNYVLDHGLASVRVRNAAGEFSAVSVAGMRAAVLASDWSGKGDFRGTLTDMPSPGAWPITMGTYVLFPQKAKSAEATLRALRFVTWGLLRGDELAKLAKFVPLPERVQAKAYRILTSVTDDQGQSLGAQALGGPG